MAAAMCVPSFCRHDCSRRSALTDSPVVQHFVHLLQFLSLAPEVQIEFCGAALPDDASELLPSPSDSDTKRYEHFWTAQMGSPFDRFYLEYRDYKRLFANRDDYSLDEGETVLDEIESRMAAMADRKENRVGYNALWGKRQLRNRPEWSEIRELASKALGALHAETKVPAEPFEHLLYVD